METNARRKLLHCVGILVPLRVKCFHLVWPFVLCIPTAKWPRNSTSTSERCFRSYDDKKTVFRKTLQLNDFLAYWPRLCWTRWIADVEFSFMETIRLFLNHTVSMLHYKSFDKANSTVIVHKNDWTSFAPLHLLFALCKACVNNLKELWCIKGIEWTKPTLRIC